jgi:uncharacterized membrane protein
MRQILKTSTYAMMHFVVAVGVAYALTQNWQIALGIGLIEPSVQTFAYTIHERLWERVPVLSHKLKTRTMGAVQPA